MLVIAAIVTAIFAWWRAKEATKQNRIAEAGLNIDRFQKGAAMLGDKRRSVRQAGIFMLSELAQQNMEEYFDQVQKVLCSFVRDRSQEQNAELEEYVKVEMQKASKDKKYKPSIPDFIMSRYEGNQVPQHIPISEFLKSLDRSNIIIADENQTAMTELSGLNKKMKSFSLFDEIKFDLRDSNLNFFILENCHFQNTTFDGCHLFCAQLVNADLRCANLPLANLEFASLNKSKLDDANLNLTNLTSSDLTDATVKNARFGNVRADKTNFQNVDLTGLEKYFDYKDNDQYRIDLSKAVNVSPEFLEEMRLRNEVEERLAD